LLLRQLDDCEGVQLSQHALSPFALAGIQTLFDLLALQAQGPTTFRPPHWEPSLRLHTLLLETAAPPGSTRRGEEEEEEEEEEGGLVGPRPVHEHVPLPANSIARSAASAGGGAVAKGGGREAWMMLPAPGELSELLDGGAGVKSRGFSKAPPSGSAAAAAEGVRGGAVMARLAREDKEREASASASAAPAKRSFVEEHRAFLAAEAAAGRPVPVPGHAQSAASSSASAAMWDRESAMRLQTTANPHFRSAVGGFEQPGGGGPGGIGALPGLSTRFK
jgi:hypothetical protein